MPLRIYQMVIPSLHGIFLLSCLDNGDSMRRGHFRHFPDEKRTLNKYQQIPTNKHLISAKKVKN